MMNRAYSVLDIKAIDEAKRVLTGVATTVTPDRMDDIVEPKGAEFTLPIPFLWQHSAREPIGNVTKARVTKEGIEVEIKIEKIEEPGRLKDRIDEAWQSIKYRLVRGLSIGFDPREFSRLESGGIRFIRWAWLELSAVTIPANQEATITTIKSLDSQLLAASGREGRNGVARLNTPGVTGLPSRPAQKEATTMKTFKEQLKDFEAKRGSVDARMAEIMQKAADESRALEQAEEEEFDRLAEELKAVDRHIVRLRNTIEQVEKRAVPVQDVIDPKGASNARSGIITVKSELPKGTLFTRYAMAVAAGKGSFSDTIEYAKRWEQQTPEVLQHIKATAGQSQTGSGVWGSELVYPTNLVSEFIELLRAATIIGRITGFSVVPFNVRIARQTGGSTVNWVGEMAPKPVTELDFDTVSLGYNKVAGIVVLTEELIRLSQPSAEARVRADLIAAIAAFIDTQFLDPTVAVGANNPASITNGVTAVAATGSGADDLYADMNVALAAFDNSNQGMETIVILMPVALARGISALRNALGQFEFTGLTIRGGTLMGFPVIVSNSVPAGTIVILKADEVLLADDGNVTLDASREATLDMNGGTSPNFNLFQRNCVAIRAERWITWGKRRTTAVAMIESAQYGPVQSS